MSRGLILLVAALVVYVSPDVQGTAHLSFSNNTEVNITRDGCGDTKLCVATPDGCDPAGNTNCLFTSVTTSSQAPSGTELSVELRGNSTGYIALGLTLNATEGTTMLFICAQNNGSFLFRTRQNNNTDNELTPTERIVREIRGVVNGSVIKCEFDIPNVTDTTLSVLLGVGSLNGSVFGAFDNRNSGLLNLTQPVSNVPTTAAPTTAAPTTAAPTTAAPTTAANTTMAANTTATTMGTTTPNDSGAVQPHAVLLLSVLALCVMLRA
ncbi:uncharacterized protein LOC115022915 [Cottoperca gobio]|uniref:Uncharacterized protein LOC115022915 n=1 Tax=Cottoperca gobio TaxID=56716 RepID=A0A6J2RI05_COTGO|nr:uncharacterized protein LOC115022915 [Cottoperca gobio]